MMYRTVWRTYLLNEDKNDFRLPTPCNIFFECVFCARKKESKRENENVKRRMSGSENDFFDIFNTYVIMSLLDYGLKCLYPLNILISIYERERTRDSI